MYATFKDERKKNEKLVQLFSIYNKRHPIHERNFMELL